MNQDRKPRYVLRKLTIGLASVMFGALLFTSTQMVHADEVTNDATETASSVKDLNGVSSETETDEKPVVATNASTEQPAADPTKLEDNVDKSAEQEKLVPKSDDAAVTRNDATENNEAATDKSKEEQAKTVANSVVDQINWDAVHWEKNDNNDVLVLGWDLEKGGADVLLPNTADFYMKGIIDKDHIAEINVVQIHEMVYSLSYHVDSLTVTISYNKSADLTNSKLIVGKDLDGSTNLDYAFSSFYDSSNSRFLNPLREVDLTNLDVSNVTSMSHLFDYADSLEEADLTGWDTSNCQSLTRAFDHTLISNIDLSTWNVSNVKDFTGMFRNTRNLERLNISNWQINPQIYSNGKPTDVLCLFTLADHFSDEGIRLGDNGTSGLKTLIAYNVNLNGHRISSFSTDHPTVVLSDIDPLDYDRQFEMTDTTCLSAKNSVCLYYKDEDTGKVGYNTKLATRTIKNADDIKASINEQLNYAIRDLKNDHYVITSDITFHGKFGATGLTTDIDQLYTNFTDTNTLSDDIFWWYMNYGIIDKIFSDDSPRTNYWTVYVAHEKKYIDHPVKAGEIVDDAQGNWELYPEDVNEKQLTKTIKRTINIIDPQGNRKTIVQNYDFNRTAVFDLHDKKITFNEWTSKGNQTLDRIDLPEIPGYALSQKVDEVHLTPETEDMVVNVIYLANDGTQTISYVDDETGEEVGTQKIEGKTDQVVPVTAQIPENWVAVDEIPKEVKIAVQDQSIKIRLKHATELVTPDKPTLGLTQEDLTRTITRTINIIDPSGKSTTITQSVTFTRTAIVDLVDASIEYWEWSENGRHLFEKIDVPTIAGYTPSQAKVDSLEVTPETKPAKISITIKYVKNEVPAITSEDSEQVTVEDDKTSSQAPSEFQIVNGILMHNAIGYDENARATMIKFKEYTPIKYLPELVTIAGKKFYKLADKNLYVKASNVTGDKRVLTHNAYIYDSKGKRIGKFKKLIKGKKVTTYGKFFKLKDGKKYFRIGKNQYLKVVNFK